MSYLSVHSIAIETRPKRMELDSALEQLGHWGKFQLISYGLLCVPIVFHAVFYLTYVFTAMQVEHRCLIPECGEDPLQTEFRPPWLTSAVPFDSGRPVGCHRYEAVQGAVLPENGSCVASMFRDDVQVACTEWVYPKATLSIMSEWNMTCDGNSHWMLSLVGTINNIGRLFGMPIAGFVSDRYGRRTILLLGLGLAGVMGMLRSYATNYVFFLAFEFLDPLFNAGLYSASFILGMELMGPQKRVMWSAFTHSVYAVGEALLGGVAWALQDWRWILRAFYGPAILSLAVLWMLPESVRWLCSKGRTKEARIIIRRAAVMNKMSTKQLDLEEMKASIAEEAKAKKAFKDDDREDTPSTWWALKETFKSKVLRVRLLTCSFCWITNTFVYYGLSLNSVSVSGNLYLNFMLVCLIEVPAGLVTWMLMERVGRRMSMCASLVLTGLSCLAFLLMPDTEVWQWIRIVTYLIGKFGITVSYTVLYVLTAELFPTNVRHSLFAMCSAFGRIGSIIAPQAPLLNRILESLPVILFGTMSLISGLLALVFPETHNTKLPDTIEEAENIGKSKKKGGGADTPTANGGSGDVIVDITGDLKHPVKKTSVTARPTRISVTSMSGRPHKKTSVCSMGTVQVTVPEKGSTTPTAAQQAAPAENSSAPTSPAAEPETVTVHL
ncbi:organic cation transporter protein isoform X1 [Frankliniella occidentalis]|uniref:Organic cation transporter protein isoform X1 n=2 Tax=Frankliniella occidentalis TaxID=133901 RepID=A0A6J1T5K0_FRAOC|nr:organic cation transporter protein isoform X1 [Frankliniella occidentalis]